MSSGSGYNNLMRNATQAQLTGSINPPNMASISNTLLSAASPVGTNLITGTKVDTTQADAAAASCRSYSGIQGLRKLQSSQANRTFYEAGCGWRYKPSGGLNPEVNQGALGTSKGPKDTMNDNVLGNTTWYWDLAKAEKDVSTAVCGNARQCASLSLMGDNANVCGYCKDTKKMIPIVNGAAKYPKDNSLACAAGSIVTAAANCPSSQGFTGSMYRSKQGLSGYPSKEGFAGYPSKEGFAATSIDSLQECTSPLTRDCVIQAARMAGCSDNGTLISALGQSQLNGDYDTNLLQNGAYTTYQKYVNPNITSAIMKDGSASISTALQDFGNVLKNMNSVDTKTALAARDLCITKGAFDSYNFCAEITPTTIINNTNIVCAQQYWTSVGGTTEGAKYPTLDMWNGQPYRRFLDMVNGLTEGFISSSNLNDLMGIDAHVFDQSKIPASEYTRGAEVVWIDTSGPTILRCDLNLATNGEIIPIIKNNVNSNMAFTAAFELRPPYDTSVVFNITSSDGFMLSMNQNPFENTKYANNDWGAWRNQPASYYTSPEYPIKTSASVNNTVVMKWFNQTGKPTFEYYISDYTGNPFDTTGFMYVTQEPVAPWLQYEICNRPNTISKAMTKDGLYQTGPGGAKAPAGSWAAASLQNTGGWFSQGSSLGFFEKRFNGPAALLTGTNTLLPSFDAITSGGVVFQTDDEYRRTIPANKGCMSFTGLSSSWKTVCNFAFGGFKSISLLIRPSANLANGASSMIFSHTGILQNGKQVGVGMALTNNGSIYYITNGSVTMPIKMNAWNLVVIQYIQNSTNTGVVTHSFVCDALDNLKNDEAIETMASTLSRMQGLSSSVGVWPNTMPGKLALGASLQMDSFIGDVAWLHGFRDYLVTPEMLKAEITQSWVSRWPRGEQ
jgi:hypothetical protein